MSSFEALLPEDLEKHVQVNRARLTSYGVLRGEIRTYCECGGHANARNAKQKGSSHLGGDDPMDIGAFGKGKGKQSKGKHGEGKGKWKQGQQGQHGQDKDKSKGKNKDSIECRNCGKRGHYSKECWSKKNTNKGGSKGKHKPKNADAHNLDSKPSNVEPEVEIGGFNMFYLDAHAVQVRGSEWIKIGVDTGAGKTAWPQSITYGRTIPGDSDPTFRTATGERVKGGKRLHVEDCDDWGSNLRVRGIQAPVCKPLLSVGEYTTMGGVTVLCGDKGYTFHKSSNVAKKLMFGSRRS